MSYGYGLSASLFQMARSYTVFANGGRVIPATLLKTDKPPWASPFFPDAPPTRYARCYRWLQFGPAAPARGATIRVYSVGDKSGTAHKTDGQS